MDMHRRALVGLGVAGATLAAAARAGAAPDPIAAVSVEGDAAGHYGAAIDDIRAYAARHMEVYGLPGLTVSLVAPDGTTAFMRFGHADVESRTPVRPDHLFQVGSISKSFTALCIFRLMEAGKLSLDADVRDLLPGVLLPPGKTSVQNLLNHSSGLPDDAPLFPRGGDGRLWRGFEPGARWSYSNLGFLMLGLIAERVDGRPLPEVIRQQVLAPLGMNSTKPAILTEDRALYAQGYAPFYSDRGYPRAGPLAAFHWTDMTAGSGCVASTAGDMARYARYLVAAGQGKGAPLLSDAGAARFARATIDAPGWAVPGSKYANGLAVVDVGGRMLLHHTGGMLGFNSAIHIDPQAGVGAFASTNVGAAPYRPRDITAYACARLRAAVEGGAPSPAPAPPKAPDPTDYLGQYESRSGRRLTVVAVPRGLSARVGDMAYAVEASEADVFIVTAPQATAFPLVFRRSGKTVTRAWFEGAEFVRVEAGARLAPFSPPTPPALEALTGHYASDDPWVGSFRVTAQGEALFLDDTTPLTALPDGSFRAGDKDWSPERLRFDALLDGRPQRAILSGRDHERRPG
jgi:CubicO group peptidase (beta-lactamase class C family)